MDMSGSMGGMMNQIPPGWTDLGNGLFLDENGNQHQERVFNDLFQMFLTHIGKLSGNDSGDFPETFSKIYDFK